MSDRESFDPAMPRVMTPEVERALRTVLSFRNTPTPIEVYDTIREALERSAAASAGSGSIRPHRRSR